MKTVAAGDEIAADGARLPGLRQADCRLFLQPGEARRLDVELDHAAIAQPTRDQVLYDFMLAIDGDRPTIGQLAQIDAMPTMLEAQLDAVMRQPVALQALPDSGLHEKIGRALFENTGANSAFDMGAAFGLDDDVL